MQPIDSTFSVPPFPAFPSVSRYVPLGSVQEALDRVCRSIDAREGVALVLGPPGTGKSLVCGLLADRYCDSHDVVLLGDTPIKDSTAFQRHLLHHLGAEVERVDTSDLHLALMKRVRDADSPQGGLLILVDEAQSLSAEVIEAIRMATNIMRDGQPRVFAVLCGNVTLEEMLVSTSLEAFTQRVSTRCYLHAMNVEETRAYIHGTIRQCGADPDNTVTCEAIATVHHACMGVPRLVNQIMTEAIDCAADAGQTLIDEQVIERAWAQLQQLPSPIVEEKRILSDASPVEFGELAELSPEVKFDANRDHKRAIAAESDTPFDDLEIAEPACFDSCEVETSSDESHAVNSPQTELPFALQLEPERPTASISAAELFGEFEVEEDLAVGSAIREAAPKGAGDEDAALESLLHQEVIGLSSIAASGLEHYAVSGDELATDMDTDSGLAVRFPEVSAEDFIDEPIENESRHPSPSLEQPSGDDTESYEAGRRNDNPELAIRELPKPPHLAADGQDRHDGDDQDVGDDDTDLLVIEDEVRLTRVDEVKRVDAREKTISVDFQAMLSRMRSRV